jgi:hypothetical protein
MAVQLPSKDIESFKESGYLIIRDLLSPTEVEDLQQWAQEVHDWKPTPESIFMPYEVCSLLVVENRLSVNLKLRSE